VTDAGPLRVLSAGAAKGVVLALAETFGAAAGTTVCGVFDAAGAIRARFVDDRDADVVILPDAMLRTLAGERRIDAETMAALGAVPTGIAVPSGDPAPAIFDAEALAAALLDASALYCPDTRRATAGIHFRAMLRGLDIEARVASKLREHANGAAAMAAMAAAPDRRGAIGCTQATEILYTQGVTLIGPLPPPYELTTTYAVAVASASARVVAARQFAALLTSAATLELRRSAGFAARPSTASFTDR
jgi:molybdate transport system substrate-binding protein